MTLSESLDQYSSKIEEWLKKSKKAAKDVQRFLTGVRTGDLKKLEQFRQAAQESCSAARLAADEVETFNFNAELYLQYGGGYIAELKEEASRQSVTVFEGEGILFCYPVLIRFEPKERGVRIDKKLYTRIAPKFLVKILANLQRRPRTDNSQRFIEVLLDGYQLLRAKKGPRAAEDLSLKEIYEILTLLPETRRSYTELDFVRDIYFLDASGVLKTRDGHQLRLHASTAIRQARGLYRFVTREGKEKVYAHISFTQPT